MKIIEATVRLEVDKFQAPFSIRNPFVSFVVKAKLAVGLMQ